MTARKTTATAKVKVVDYGPIQLPNHLGLELWQFDAACARGLIPEPDRDGRWSAERADELTLKVPEIIQELGTEAPIGANRAAGRLAQRTGLEVERADVLALVEQELLAAVGEYKDWPLYAVRDLDRLAEQPELLAGLIAERQAWQAASLTRRQAAALLGWRLAEFDQVVSDRKLPAGRLGRFDQALIEQLAGDEALAEQVEADRLIGPDQAAVRLEIRPTDWRYCVAAGWIAPSTYVDREVGRYRTVSVPLYRTGDVDALRELRGVDWEAVRACHPGDPSPLRAYARLAPSRAAVLRRFVARLGARYDVEAWAWYDARDDAWEIDWTRNDAGEPTRAQVAELLADDPAAACYRRCVELDTPAGSAIRWARAMLAPGAACILDTETTSLDGAICEIAVIAADTGEVLLDTLIDPGEPISPGAQMIHGIRDQDVAGAPRWPQVWPRLLEVTAGRVVLAYNAEFDSGRIHAEARRYHLDPAHLGEPDRWGCLMNRRSEHARIYRWLPLGGGHRARGDVRTARDLLLSLTTP